MSIADIHAVRRNRKQSLTDDLYICIDAHDLLLVMSNRTSKHRLRYDTRILDRFTFGYPKDEGGRRGFIRYEVSAL